MKAKTKRRLSQVVFLSLAVVFLLGWTILLYLPPPSSNQATPPPPLNQIPEAQQNAPVQNPAAPAATPGR